MDLRIDNRTSPAAKSESMSRPVGDSASDSARRARLELLDEDALRQLLVTEPVIEQAKGLLMGYYRIGSEEAFAVLRRWSAMGHVKVRDLAVRLVQAASRPGTGPFDPLVGLAAEGEGRASNRGAITI